MRAILAGLMMVGLAGWAGAEDKKGDKIDAKKLVGKWESKDKKDAKMVVEFTKDGKVMVNIDGGGKEFKLEGTYKLDGNKLTSKVKVGDEEKTMVRTISKLTATELTSKDEKGKEDTLMRVKDGDK